MQATRVHVGIVLAELSKDFIDEGLMNEAKIRSSGIDSTVLGHYVILRAEFHADL